MAPVSTEQLAQHAIHLRAEVGELQRVCAWRGAHDDVYSALGWKYVLSDDFAQPALEAVSIHR